MGGAMDLVASPGTKVVITMEHTAKVRFIFNIQSKRRQVIFRAQVGNG